MEVVGHHYGSDMGLFSFYAGSWVIALAITIVIIVACWKLYKKAGRPGWASLIPIYSQYVLFDIATGKGILFLLLIIPVVNVIITVYLYYKLACAFGKGLGFTLGLIFLNPIFVCILGLGSAEYQGPQ